MRVVYFGSGAFGLPTLRALAQEHELAAIVSQPDKPAGRGGKTTPTPVSLWAIEHAPHVPLLRPPNVNEAPVLSLLASAAADAYVIIAFGQKLGPELLKGVFAINLHASLLPRWRGAAPINHAILAGDHVTGNSVITLAERMDAGLILGQSEREIAQDTTAGELHDQLAQDGAPLVLTVLKDRLGGKLETRLQDETLVTRAGKLSRADAVVDFTQSAFTCARRVNGLSPWPGVNVMLAGVQVRLVRARPEPGVFDRASPGELADPRQGLAACWDGTERVRLLGVQPAGGKVMTWEEFARGRLAPAIAGGARVAIEPHAPPP